MGALRKSLILLAGLLLALGNLDAQPRQDGSQQEPPVVFAVIVNPKNPTANLTLDQLRSHFRLTRQYWPKGRPCEVYLRPSRSDAMKMLLEKVYRTTDKELRKYWIGKIFRGEIKDQPAVVPTAAAAGARVRDVIGAITVVEASEVPKGVRVLTIDGKKPGDKDYPLIYAKAEGPTLP